MISVHWIPTHRGQEDKERFVRWKPPFVKIVSVDERPPYTEDIPTSATIVIRNHPMSELYGQRRLPAISAADDGDTTARYEAYFAAFLREARGAPSARYRDGFSRTPPAHSAEPGRANHSGTGQPSGTTTVASPEQIGTEHAAACQRMAQYCEGKGVARTRLLFEGLNEPQLWANEPPDLTALYYQSFLNGLHGYGLHGVVGNFGVGWPGNGGVNDAPPLWDFFKPVIDIMQAGDYLGLHEYWALNGPQQNWRWWAGRFLQCPYQVPILITECGIDTGVAGSWYAGWRELPGDTLDQKAARYVDEIYWYAKQCSTDGRVRGIFPFTYDLGGLEWEKFDIRDQVWLESFFRKLDAAGMPQAGTIPTPPPAGPKIVPTVRDCQPQEGGNWFDGYVRDAQGDPVDEMRIVFSWKSDGEWSVPPQISGPHQGYEGWAQGYYSHVIHTGQPKAADWYIWIIDEAGERISEVAKVHTDGPGGSCNQFAVDWKMSVTVTPPAAPPPTPPPGPSASVVQAIRNVAWNQLGIPYNPEASFAKYAREHTLGNPVTTEFEISGYRAQGFTGGILCAKVGDWTDIQVLTW
jgi:hypothetical protein